MSCANISPENLGKCIKWWQRVLNIEHWRIEYKVVPPEKMTRPTNLMEFRPTRARMYAMILVRQDVLRKFDAIEVQKLLVHELAHLIYDPIAEEHGLQVQFSMDGAKAEESNFRFTQVLEKAVEHTAQMLMRVLPVRTSWGDDEESAHQQL